MNYDQALAQIPTTAEWSCSFGYPGEGGFCEHYRMPNGRRFAVENGSYLESAPFNWTVREIDAVAQ